MICNQNAHSLITNQSEIFKYTKITRISACWKNQNSVNLKGREKRSVVSISNYLNYWTIIVIFVPNFCFVASITHCCTEKYFNNFLK